MALFFSVPRGLFAEELWYEANSLGTPLRLLEPEEAPGGDYTLSVRTDGAREVRRLFDSEQKETRRWERLYAETGSLAEETVFIDGARDSRTLYHPSGLVKEEIIFKDGKEDGRFLFRYPPEEPGAKPPPLMVSFSRPEAGFRDEYSYLPSGGFRGVKRIYDDGEVYSSVFESRGGILFAEWHSFGKLELLFRYDARGSLSYTEEYRGGVLVERTAFRYDSEAPFRLRERTTRDAATGRQTLREYADDGFPRQESVFENGSRVEQTSFTHTDGLLVRKERRHRRGREEWAYFYDEEKTLARENYSRDGELEKIVYHETGEDYTLIEEYYRKGEVFLRLYFKDGEEVRRHIAAEDGA
ncbi:MAG: hypothetical protein FWG35_01915 [Spirochaetaceae bacterium]|nr:hypothetical protein [Spirochaetaceae bacterium]